MTALIEDPIGPGALSGFARRFRRGETSAEEVTRAYLQRIAALDPALGAFEFVAADGAIAAARAIDAARAAGVDLGPLMGVPIAIKDLFAVDGTPTRAGTNLDVADLIGAEGSFVRRLRRLGCVILGKVKTVEFALGGTGINTARGTPRNPWDARVFREPGGSSSGSAVAVAAGLCAFSIGSDTTGSVRGPAAFCGVFGLKTTKGLWPTDGVFPLAPTLDTIGPLTKSAADAAHVFAALTATPIPGPAPARGTRLAKPYPLFFDDLEPPVAACTAAALDALVRSGVEIVPVEVGVGGAVVADFSPFLPTELIASLGRERFARGRDAMDGAVAERAAEGLGVPADAYVRLLRHHQALCAGAPELLGACDGWITPTRAILPPPVADGGKGTAPGRSPTKWPNTQFGSFLGLCGTSSPIHALGSPLPVGLQVMCPAFADAKALAIALLIEKTVGLPRMPDLTPFLRRPTQAP